MDDGVIIVDIEDEVIVIIDCEFVNVIDIICWIIEGEFSMF